ncbi:Uncharacterized conserved protein YdaU, DUF1376 family [Nitrosospira sp. Nsp18]|uniref:YdaU family protein n=1 Tax=Nitrosospira sp. Nsp18 TaxID=1855334 RepID=UPI0008820040|nr:YdaU family protein [Nitrosospira sp. Nsp18]SDA16341.1 Uncharacterized conserved protein YdaU, DUF1376 family [Nitrosospira sp. Nsp18]
MNYYERYCGDYQRDTAHLSLAEHGAYTMLLDTYFSVEKPLPKELSSLYRVCRAMTRLEQHAVKVVADQFFPVSEMDGLRHNHRADREIAKARPKIEAARINGKKGGRPPKESFQQTRQETRSIPDGLSTGCGNITAAIPVGEPDGKAHQHQHQHQPHLDRDCSSTRTIYSPEEQVRVSDIASGVTSPVISDVYSSPIQPIEAESRSSAPPGAAGVCCKALARHGVQGSNPHHPTLLALLQAGAVEDEFVQAAKNAIAKGKENFAYVIGTVKRQREEAAKLVLHQGRMPNRQELLESSNRAATKGWLPPELRLAEAGEPQSGDTQHAN